MLISDRSARKQRNALGLIFGALALLVAAMLAFAAWPQRSPYALFPEGSVFCGAEQVRGGQLVEGGQQFGSATLRSKTQAHSGRWSCFLPAAGEAQYGFGYQFDKPEPGTAYKASVWRLKNAYSSGILAVKLEGGPYIQESSAVESDEQGWERLEIRFIIPYGQDIPRFNVYVYAEGHTEVYFDDLLIEQLPAPGGAFRPEVLNLYLKKESLEALRQKRDEALKAGILESSDGDWVEAQLEGDSTGLMDAEVRLKGDWLDHLHGDKWSFRVKMKGPYAWRRMRSFSLHTPLARYFLHEWVLHQLWEREDVLTTRYDFVELRLNGESLGIYAYEEHFEKQLVEYRQRREGPILKFSEDGFWKAIKRQLSHHGFVKGGPTHAPMEWANADIQAFKESSLLEDSTMAREYEEARRLMEQYRQGQVAPDDVFDLTRLARYYALCDITNAYHGIAWHNQRFYYNPVTSKLEPIGFDGFGDKPETRYTILGEGALNPASLSSESIFSALFMDEAFAAAYIGELYRLSSRSYLSAALDSLYPAWAARLAFLQMEFPDYKPDLSEFLTEGQFAHSLLLPYDNQSLLAYTQQQLPAGKRLQARNRHNLPIAVVGYGTDKKKMDSPLPEPMLLPASTPRRYWARLQRDSMVRDYNSIRFLEEGALQNQAAPVYYSLDVGPYAKYLFFKVPGIDSLFHAPILNYAPPEGATGAQKLRRLAALRTGGPYQVEGQRVIFSAGEHRLKDMLVLPAGYLAVFEAGATLVLEQGAHFISFSPVQAYGTEEQPIRITSPDGTGSFTVIQPQEYSSLSNVHFEGLNTLRYDGWALTGAVTFYEADVRLYHCTFLKNHCEDGLNIIRSEFELRQCLFGNTPSDAFDSDFSRGAIEDCRFQQTGNDGMDFSGSVVNIRNCTMEGNGDKGLSVGEESDVTLFDSSVRNANIAVASKDLSMLYVKNLSMEACVQGFAAYQKKPEYGGSKIVVESYKAKDVKRLHAISEGCMLQLEGQIIQ
ncbi:MAG: CotH kinase family protein [Phaeodactylibacter sp.]|nr:CotH kinase family protein [Phaeodactylibacter sp.]MCB9274802.1 CotH kinase family protein [Lewinellaceae bacterium]